MNIYVIRHGETQWNTEKRMQGWGNSDLTELGVAQAKAAGYSLANTDFKSVFVSPLGRTLETVHHIIGDRNLEPIIMEDFKEMGFGCWEGSEPSVLETNYGEQYYNFWNQAHKYIPVDGESFETIQKRVIKGIHNIIDAHKDAPDSNILLVTHGMIIKVLLLYISGLPLERLWDSSVVHPSSLTIIEADLDYNLKVLDENNIDHLDPL